MPKAKNNHHLYTGRAGHLASMSECLSRGWNVAIPEVDIGEDIFVVEDETSLLVKVQVKTATGKKYKKGFTAQFIIPKKQIDDTSIKGNDLRFVFVSRFNKMWHPFIILTRKELQDLYIYEHIGSLTNKELKLTVYYSLDDAQKIINVECGTQKGYSKASLTKYIDKWDSFFKIRILEGN
jgi:hypothetical protein